MPVLHINYEKLSYLYRDNRRAFLATKLKL